MMWEVIEKLVRRAVHIESSTQAESVVQAGEKELDVVESGSEDKNSESKEEGQSKESQEKEMTGTEPQKATFYGNLEKNAIVAKLFVK